MLKVTNMQWIFSTTNLRLNRYLYKQAIQFILQINLSNSYLSRLCCQWQHCWVKHDLIGPLDCHVTAITYYSHSSVINIYCKCKMWQCLDFSYLCSHTQSEDERKLMKQMRKDEKRGERQRVDDVESFNFDPRGMRAQR